MRKALNRKLIELAAKDKDVMLITADLGYKVFKEFREKYPKQYLNVGIAEANMIGVAAGLALNQKKVFVYSMATFATMRCFEQIRVDLCYQNLPVKIIGGGAGLTYGDAGATHQAIEDIAIMNALPNMTVVCPGDPLEVEKTVEKSMELEGPCYIRITKNGEREVHKNIEDFEIGKALEIHSGKEIVIVTTGNMLNTAIDVREALQSKNIDCGIVSFHTVKPMDHEMIKELSNKYDVIISVEEHIKECGLGSKIANVIVDNNLPIRLVKIGITDEFVDCAGDSWYQRNKFGLTKEEIVAKILKVLKELKEIL